jgi:sugar lactone lactonase YvrE
MKTTNAVSILGLALWLACAGGFCFAASIPPGRYESVFATNQGEVIQFDLDGNVLQRYGGNLGSTSGLAVDSQARLYIGEFSHDAISVFSLDGTLLTRFDAPNPFDMVYHDNSLLVADTDGFVRRYGLDGSGGEPLIAIETGAYGLELVDGELYVASPHQGDNARVHRFALDGTPTGSFPVRSFGGNFLGSDHDGNLLYQGFRALTIDRFSADGTYQDALVTQTPPMPFGLDKDAAGNLYLTGFNGKLNKYDVDGGLVTTFSDSETGFNVLVATIPEPGSATLLTIGMLLASRRMRRSA